MGSKIGAILEFEDSSKLVPQLSEHKSSFRGQKPLTTSFLVLCPWLRSYQIRLQYEGLKNFCYRCSHLGHSTTTRVRQLCFLLEKLDTLHPSVRSLHQKPAIFSFQLDLLDCLLVPTSTIGARSGIAMNDAFTDCRTLNMIF